MPSKSTRSGTGMRRPAPGDGIGAGYAGVPDLLLVDPPHLDLVAVALGDEQPRGRTVHLDHRVVGGGGAVHEDLDLGAEVGERSPKALGQLGEPFITPSDWSSRVVGVLSRTTSPSGVTAIRSVNVPPTSTPTR